MFCALPPPMPSSIQSNHSRLNSSNYNNSQQTNQNNQSSTQCYSNYQYSMPNMSSYYSASAPCFHGTCLVTMANGTKKKVSNIKQGDYVLCPSSTHTITTDTNKKNTIIVARVESILRTFSRFGTMDLVSFQSGLLVTPWHPIKMNGVWTFPSNTIGNGNGNENESKMVCKLTEAVYSFLLGSEIILEIDGENDNFDYETLDHLNLINLQQHQQQQDDGEEKGIKRGQCMLINEIECITLAHGIENDEVATHSFYGTEKVVNSMKKRVYSKSSLLSLSSQFSLPEYVDLYEGDVIKDNENQLACGFKE